MSGHDVSQTVAERTATAIRDRILAVEPGYQPGERLFPDGLAESLGVSITPVREALQHLSSEGLVELLPRRGARVASMTVDEIADLTAVRGGVELLALRLVKGGYPEDELAELGRCLDVCAAAIGSGDTPTYRAHDTEFHRRFVAVSHSPTLMQVYEQLHRRSQILELYFHDTWAARKESLAEHRELVHMLGQATREEIEAAIWRHWERSRIRISDTFSQVAHQDGKLQEGRPSAAGRQLEALGGTVADGDANEDG